MATKKIVFLGGKEIGAECFSYLVENARHYNAVVSAVLTNERKLAGQPGFSVSDICHQNQIPVLNSLDDLLNIEDIDIIISVQYHQVLKDNHLKKARLAVNLHMAPLPDYRGCNQFSFAIIDKATEFGTTLHLMEERIDAGDILFEKRFELPADWNVQQLYEKTFNESVYLFKDSLRPIIEGHFRPVSQNSLAGIRKSSFYIRSDIEKIKKIDLNWDREKIWRHFRATYFPPFPPPYAIIDGQRVDVTPEWMAEMGYS